MSEIWTSLKAILDGIVALGGIFFSIVFLWAAVKSHKEGWTYRDYMFVSGFAIIFGKLLLAQ